MAVRFGSGNLALRALRDRRLAFERLEDRRLLSLSHLYTFNDGLANDWIGSAHGKLFNGAQVTNGQLVLSNSGVTSGTIGVVQYMGLPANVLPAGDATVVAWYTTADPTADTRVLEFGNQISGAGDSYLSLLPNSTLADTRAVLHPSGGLERVASGAATADGTQHMAVVVIDTAAALLRLYIDGTETGTSPLDGASGSSISGTIAYLGRSITNSAPGFTGSINEVRIYDEALAPAAVSAEATAGSSALTKSPLVRQMEYLDRGMVVVRRSTTQAYIGWRLLATDPSGIAFNLYRSTNGGAPVKLNPSPLTVTTDFVDSTVNLSAANDYFVRPVIGGIEQDPSKPFTLAANSPVQQFLNVPLQIPTGGTTPTGEAYTYSANDASVGDVDGDGQYEIILKWDPSNSKDNSQSGYTGNVYIDAYRLDGTLLWRIDLGRNIRAGAHYTQFMVYDLDGDGRAEVAMKTAPGTIDGLGNYVLMPGDNPNADYRNSSGYVLAGPEYLTVFNGLTGAQRSTVDFIVPRHPTTENPTSTQLNDVWGDGYGNRVDRFLAGIAYLDGVHPSLMMTRGYYTRTTLTAWDFRDGALTERWGFDTNGVRGGLPAFTGQGDHSLSVADVDNDGKDEIIYGAMVIDDNGTGLYATGLGHGDALHVSDMIPSRPGLEVFSVHEDPGSYQNKGAEIRDARTGEILFSWAANNDVGRGVAADIDPNSPGFEMWATTTDPNGGTRYIYGSNGTQLYAAPSNMFYNFVVFWDADSTSELLDGTTISEWNNPGRSNFDLNPATSGTQTAPNASSNNGTKSTPALSADILGDWREEVIWRRSDSTALEIFTTIIPATSRMYTLMDDPQYREAIAWQNVGYNQPPHPSFFIGAGMAPPPIPQIYIVQFSPASLGDFNGDQLVDSADYTVWRDTMGSTTDLRADGNRNAIVDEGDYDVWKLHFGQSLGTGSGAGSPTSIRNASLESAALHSAAIEAALSTNSLPSVTNTRFILQTSSRLQTSLNTSGGELLNWWWSTHRGADPAHNHTHEDPTNPVLDDLNHSAWDDFFAGLSSDHCANHQAGGELDVAIRLGLR